MIFCLKFFLFMYRWVDAFKYLLSKRQFKKITLAFMVKHCIHDKYYMYSSSQQVNYAGDC